MRTYTHSAKTDPDEAPSSAAASARVLGQVALHHIHADIYIYIHVYQLSLTHTHTHAHTHTHTHSHPASKESDKAFVFAG